MKTAIFIFIHFIFLSCFAQQYSYKQYTVFDGLPQNQIMQIMQDSRDLIWISTKAGYSCFDGSHFSNFNFPKGQGGYIQGVFQQGDDIHFISNNSMTRISDNEASLMFKTDFLNISRIAVNTTTADMYIISDSFFYVIDQQYRVKKIRVDNDPLITDVSRLPGSTDFIVSTYEGIFSVSKTDEITPLMKGFGGCLKLIDDKLYFINLRSDKDSREKRGLYSYDGKEISLLYDAGENLLYSHFYQLKNNDFLLIQNNSCWIKVNSEGNVTDRDSLADVNICCVTEDRSGLLWFGTETGVFKLQSYAFRNYTEKSGMPKYVWSIIEDNDSDMVFASYNGKLATLQQNKIAAIHGYESGMMQYENFYMSGIRNSLGQWMIPTDSRMLFYDHGKFSFMSLVYKSEQSCALSVFEDTLSKQVYFGTTNGLIKYNLRDRAMQHFNTRSSVLSIANDKKNRMWICTGKGVQLLRNDRWVSFGKNEISVDAGVVSCARDRDGNMWYAAKDALYYYTYSNTQKVYDGQFYFVINYLNKVIIAGGATGFVYIDPDRYKKNQPNSVRLLDRFNGFIGIECGQNGTCTDSRGTVWIPTSESVVAFSPDRLMFDTLAPRPMIYSLEYAHRDLIWNNVNLHWKRNDTTFCIDPNYNNIRLSFNAVSTPCQERVRYKYRLLGYDDRWKETNETAAIFTNLKPGEYEFEVLACNENGYWSKSPVVVKFEILPAFHQTLFFRILLYILPVLLVIAVILLLIFRKQRRRMRERETERELLNMQVKTINSQLDPHFIFNAIAAIGSEVQQNNNDKAYRYFVKVSQLLRSSISDAGKITRSLDEEIEFVRNYLSLQKFRFEERFEYTMFVDENVNRCMIVPKMCLQIFVENAMKHGIEHRTEGGILKIDVLLKDDVLHMVVEDNGIGREASMKLGNNSTGVGLMVFRDFFELLNHSNDKKAGFKIEDLYNAQHAAAGTKVTVFIPVSYQYPSE